MNRDQGEKHRPVGSVYAIRSRAEVDGRSPATPSNGPDGRQQLIAEQASRMAATAVTADLEYWARIVSVDGWVGLNDLVRVLDMIREDSMPVA
jgi:hypothetical protein